MQALRRGVPWLLALLCLGWLAAAPAAAQATASPTMTQLVNGGGLNLTATVSTVNFGTVTLSGNDQTISATAGPTFSIVDATGSNQGWNVTLSSTSFSDGTGTIPASGFTFSPTGGAISTANASSQAVDASSGPREPGGGAQALSATVKAVTTAAGFGKGKYTYTPLPASFQVVVPATTVRGTGVFTATMTVTINSGP